MARGWELVAPGGVLSYVVPNAWLGIKSAAQLRRNMLELGALRKIDIFHFPIFEDPVVESVIFQAVKNGKAAAFEIAHFYSAPDGIDRARPSRVLRMPAAVCLKTPGITIPTNWNSKTADILNYIMSDSFSLSDPDAPFTPRIALQAYAAGKGVPPQSKEDVKNHVYHCDDDKNGAAHPYLAGQDVRRYRIVWSGRYLLHGQWLAEPQKLAYFTGPRIVLREILGRAPYLLCAAFLKETALYNKSVLHILPKPNCGESELLALLAILNSKLASYIMRFLGRKTQRSIFPKIVNDDLRDFPLPQNFADSVKTLSILAEKMLVSFGAPAGIIQTAGAAAGSTEDVKLQAQIDQAVCQAYSLPQALMANLYSALMPNM